MRFLVLAAALFLAASSLSSCSGGNDEDAQYKRALSAATDQARGKLVYFWEHYSVPEVDEYDFALKVAFPRKDGQSGTEDAWVENLARGPGPNDLSGELMTDPAYLGDLKRGALMSFEEKQVVDWAFLRGEELIGHYTTRVMLPRMPVEQAEGLKSMFGENPK